MKWSLLFILLLSGFVVIGSDYYVSNDGSDGNPGTLAQPFATLNAARDAIRSLAHPLASPATVYIKGGRYYLQSAFSLSNSQDSGTPTCPVIYRNYGSEVPYIIGGVVVTNFQSITNAAILARLTASAQANVLVAYLADQAITDLGVMTNHGYDHHDGDENENPFQAELLFQDRAMQLARWPNALVVDPRTNWFTIHSGVSSNTAYFWSTGTPSFTNHAEANPGPWAEVSNAWVQGFWGYDYGDSWERIVSADTNKNTLTLNWPGAAGSNDTPPNPGAYTANQRFFYFNILEELDSAGEYYIDRINTNLYFWPPNTITNGACILTITTNIVNMSGVSNVAFSGLVFEGGRSALIQISNGGSNIISGCTLVGGSADGIKILTSSDTGVSRSSFINLGQRGIWIYGSGNRTNLISGNNFITCNTFSNLSRLCIANKVAINLKHNYTLPMDEVGVYISHNLFTSLPHQAISINGNDHVIEYNEIYNVCNETGDAGAIYGGGDPTFRGTIIRYNYMHDIHMTGGASNFTGVHGIYADGGYSGNLIYGNVFCNVDHGIFINGGRDNIIQNNIFVDITNSIAGKLAPFGFYINQACLYNGFTNQTSSYWQRLTNIPYQSVLWSNKYPTLATITNGPTGVPNINVCYATNNQIISNISSNNTTWDTWLDSANTNSTILNNLTNSDPLFVSYPNHNFYLQSASPAYGLGFHWIPLFQMGLCDRSLIRPTTLNVNNVHIGSPP